MIDPLNFWAPIVGHPVSYLILVLVVIFSAMISHLFWGTKIEKKAPGGLIVVGVIYAVLFLVCFAATRAIADLSTGVAYAGFLVYLFIGVVLSRHEWWLYANSRFNKVLMIRNEYFLANNITVADLTDTYNYTSQGHVRNIWRRLSDELDIERSRCPTDEWNRVIEVVTPHPREIGPRLFVVILWWPVAYLLIYTIIISTKFWRTAADFIGGAYMKDIREKFKDMGER